jgi:SAM-dependent methyltransferase
VSRRYNSRVSDYIHGTQPDEQERLAKLNAMTNAAFVAWLTPREDDAVLEVGSGLGMLAAQVAGRAPRGRVVGLEFSEAQLARARERNAPNLEFVRGDAHQLPFADGSFDVVYCRYLLEHVADPGRVLAEMRRVLRPGGRALAQENNIEINRFDPPCPKFDALWSRFGTLQAQLGGDAFVGLRLHRLFRQAGFRDLQLSIAPEVHWSGSPGFEPWVHNLIGNIRSGERKLLETGLATPAEIAAAIDELGTLLRRDDASAIFYWNRAAGTC